MRFARLHSVPDDSPGFPTIALVSCLSIAASEQLDTQFCSVSSSYLGPRERQKFCYVQNGAKHTGSC